MEKERFSLLLLEPGEIYFEDFSVDLMQSPKADQAGRLKMCSKSIVYEPKGNLELPLIKIPYKDCIKMFKWDENSIQSMDSNILAIECNQYIEMLEGNLVKPYNFLQENKMFLFNMHYAKIDEYLPQLCQLHRASTLHAYEQNSMIATIVFSRQNRVKFSPLWLENLYEKIVVEYQVDEINPLVVNPGRMLLTNALIYFQPYNNIQPYPVIKIRLKTITNFTKRRFLLRHVGLEIRWHDNCDKEKLLYIAFRHQIDRNEFCRRVYEQNDFNVVEQIPESITLKWQNGLISNFEYLLYLNHLADRTYQDLTQYPVFPWVISNYGSDELDLNDINNYRDLKKPIGALNPERLNRLKERCEEMGDPKFLYGSHYSAPGLILFFLVRKYPKLMLCLQNGRFDHPDRMFNRMDDAYRNCMNNMADFKELIPEFYDLETKGDFLQNKMKINFGQRYDGTPVNNVALPPWAKNSTERFVSILREALESDYVSHNINHWIDLIFGYKQKGEEALKANNLFYYLCYEGSVNLDSITDLAARHAFEVQISEFGQIPKQLFKTPHVSKLIKIPALLANKEMTFELEAQYYSHKDEISAIILDEKCSNIITTSKDGTFKCYSLKEKRQIRSVQVNDMPLSSVQIISESDIILGCWDDSIIVYDLDYGKITNVVGAHDDAVSCLNYLKEDNLLISGSWDCSVKIWNNFQLDSVIGYLSLDDKVTCMDSFKFKNKLKVLIGLKSGEVFLWTYTMNQDEDNESHDNKLILIHRNGVNDVKFNKTGAKIVTCGKDRAFNVIDIDTGMTIFKRELTAEILCLNWAKNDQYLLMGNANGMLYIWDMVEGKIQLEKKVHEENVTCVAYSTEDGFVVTSGKDFRDFCVKLWTTNF